MGPLCKLIAALLLTLPCAPAAVPQWLAGERLKEATLQEELEQVGAKRSSLGCLLNPRKGCEETLHCRSNWHGKASGCFVLALNWTVRTSHLPLSPPSCLPLAQNSTPRCLLPTMRCCKPGNSWCSFKARTKRQPTSSSRQTQQQQPRSSSSCRRRRQRQRLPKPRQQRQQLIWRRLALL